MMMIESNSSLLINQLNNKLTFLLGFGPKENLNFSWISPLLKIDYLVDVIYLFS